ncbi:uncharacterized protein [Macrobrachium rosenbergii]|uniref:uncharacterized protein n=1 Tax=Macrobrachium rosenbergii TaxID=79674 RepID=UPI0034D3D025
MDLEIKTTAKGRPAHVPSTVKWWKLTQEEEARQEFKERALREVILLEGVQEWQNHNSMVIKRVGGEVLGKTSGEKSPDDKEIWWWSDGVKEVVKAKKDAKRSGKSMDSKRIRREPLYDILLAGRKALKKMKNAKAIGPDGIPAEVWKSMGEEGVDMLWDLAKKMCSQEKKPKE